MMRQASSVGELASRLLSRGRGGTVTRAFERSAYVKTGDDFLLLLWGEARSPMTVNVARREDRPPALKAGETCELSSSGLRGAEVEVATRGVPVYRSSLRRRRAIRLPEDEDLLKGASMLRALYDASPHGPTLLSDPALRGFADDVLRPYAKSGQAPKFRDFRMVGRGGGFTPAGDDFAAGFTAVYNYIARSSGRKEVEVSGRLAASRTVPESAAIMVYSSRGYVDEGLERLILDSTSGSRSEFFADLTSMAPRGHTSGLDLSTGVLLAEAHVADAYGGREILRACMNALLAGRTRNAL